MKRNTLIAIVIVVLLAGGGVVVISEKRRIRRALRLAAVRANLDPDFIDAIAYVESRWRLNAVNKAGRDGARGGAWGPTQITEKTARDHGYTGIMEAFTKDADLAALWTAKILRTSSNRRHLETLADYVAAWNAGRDDADRNDDGWLEELPATHSTRADYLPKAIAALAIVRAEGIA